MLSLNFKPGVGNLLTITSQMNWMSEGGLQNRYFI